MINSAPLISVVIPVYNREDLIKSSINSILNQTYQNFEIIIIDDGSTDKTSQMIQELEDTRIKYFLNPANEGVSYSRNRGIRLSTSDIIVFQDSDDLSHPLRLEKQASLLLGAPVNIGAVYCAMEFYDRKTGNITGSQNTQIDFRKNFTTGKHLLTPGTGTLMIWKHIFDEVGYFDEKLNANEDTEMAIRVSKKYDYAFSQDYLVKVTRNHDQLMNNSLNYILAKEIIYQKHKSYLSPEILYKLCKMLANYYILTGNYSKAKYYVLSALTHKKEIKTFFQYTAVCITPSLIGRIYKAKYKNIPLSSGLK